MGLSLGVQELPDPLRRPSRIRDDLAFPQSDNLPPSFGQPLCDFDIAPAVVRDFRYPVVWIGPPTQCGLQVSPVPSVPEVAVTEDSDSWGRED